VVGTDTGKHPVRFQEGSLESAQFDQPYSVCQWRGSLFVTDVAARVIAEVEGAFGGGSTGIVAETKAAAAVKGRGGGIPSGDAYVAAVLPVLLDSIPVLPKELARLMVSYARPTGVRRIAGALDSSQKAVDGPALNGALLSGANGIAIDLSDGDGQGPALIFVDYHVQTLRAYHFRSETVTTIAGPFGALVGVCVAANGVIFVGDTTYGSVDRISAARPVPAATSASALSTEGKVSRRTVTTVVGLASVIGLASQSHHKSMRMQLSSPLALCLRPVAVPKPSAVSAAEGEIDAVRLFVGCDDGVHAFDMVQGEHKHFRVRTGPVSGVAVTDDGARLFAVQTSGLLCVDLATEKVTTLISGIPQFRALRVGPQAQGEFEYCASCVIDAQSRALIICDQNARRLIRVRGVDV
jgi:hypothetical protein